MPRKKKIVEPSTNDVKQVKVTKLRKPRKPKSDIATQIELACSDGAYQQPMLLTEKVAEHMLQKTENDFQTKIEQIENQINQLKIENDIVKSQILALGHHSNGWLTAFYIIFCGLTIGYILTTIFS